MIKIRNILNKYDHKRGTRELFCAEKFEFESLSVIGLFTSENDFCNKYQTDGRNLHSGCKWRLTEDAFQTGLMSLKFVQKMGPSV